MTLEAELEDALEQAAILLGRARHAVALTGAGLSAESGIPTYRGPDGVWTRFGEPTIDGWDLFVSDPAEWWRQALESGREKSLFQQALDAAVPNEGHFALADLERHGRLAHVITQNIDGLHAAAGTLSLTEIHGNRYRVRCMNCGLREPAEHIPTDRLPPVCPECGGNLKTDVVMFGEPIPRDALEDCERHAVLADVFLVIGTSAVVYPAASFPIIAKRRGAPLIEINPFETDLSPIADVVIRMNAGQGLPELAARTRI